MLESRVESQSIDPFAFALPSPLHRRERLFCRTLACRTLVSAPHPSSRAHASTRKAAQPQHSPRPRPHPRPPTMLAISGRRERTKAVYSGRLGTLSRAYMCNARLAYVSNRRINQLIPSYNRKQILPMPKTRFGGRGSSIIS